MKDKLEVRNFIRMYLNENLQRSGGYSTEEMDAFINELIHLFQFNNDDDVVLYQMRNSVNVPSDRNSSVMSVTAQDLINNWSTSKERFGQENPTWYIWDVETKDYKDANSIMKHAYQRYDKDSVLDFVRNNPEKIKRIKVSFDSEPQQQFGKAMMSGAYGSLDEVRDLVKEVIQEVFWTGGDWDDFLNKEKTGDDQNKKKELKGDIIHYIESENFSLRQSVEYIMHLAQKIYPGVGEYDLIDLIKGILTQIEREDDRIESTLRDSAMKVYDEFDYAYQRVNEAKKKKKKKKSRKPKDVGHPYVMGLPSGTFFSFDAGVDGGGE
jgi:hypothetical protein